MGTGGGGLLNTAWTVFRQSLGVTLSNRVCMLVDMDFISRALGKYFNPSWFSTCRGKGTTYIPMKNVLGRPR